MSETSDCISWSCSITKTQLWLCRRISYEKWAHMQLLVMVKPIKDLATKVKLSSEISHFDQYYLLHYHVGQFVLVKVPSCCMCRAFTCDGSRWTRWHVQSVASHLEAWTCRLVLLRWDVSGFWYRCGPLKCARPPDYMSGLVSLAKQAPGCWRGMPKVASYTCPCTLSGGQGFAFNQLGWKW